VAFSWTMMFGLVPRKDVFVAYAERIASRPAFQRINAADDEWPRSTPQLAAGERPAGSG
jgi:glutathione S-transferase